MKKRSFVLLEILIALFLISICTALIISNPLYFYKREIKELEELELKILEYEVFCKIKKKLIKNKISIKDLPKKKEEAKYLRLKDERIVIDGLIDKKIPIYYLIWGRAKSGINEKYVKLHLQISLKEPFKKRGRKYFIYFLFIKKIPKIKKKSI
ncbi:MAG: hypothetical protein AMS24_01585 [Chlamydiae bacterium SM23_39]|nr:MAG: hypothetical protein AMS24_01585 [Chlamydiae bacterium SM23_39]